MTNTQIIQSWKNPELRKNEVNHPSGQSFSELSVDEMMNIQGAGDVHPETVPTNVTTLAGPVTMYISRKFC